MSAIEQNIMDFLLEVKESIINELRQQGHVATGTLINTIETTVITQLDSYVGYIKMQDYALPLNTGFKPKFTMGSGAGSSEYIKGLLRWLEVKQIGLSHERLGIAFAIAKTAAKTGHPTPGSYSSKYTKNGRRKDFTKYAIEPMLTGLEQKLGLEQVFLAIFEDAIINATA